MLNLSLVGLLSVLAIAQSDGKLRYLDPSLTAELKQALPAPPAQGSKEQKDDEQKLFKFQSARKEADCKRAESEIEATLNGFFGPPNGPLTTDHVTKLDEFFKTLRNETAAFIGPLKDQYKRQRPYDYIKGLDPCIKRETSGSYPSGHAILTEVYALVLSDLFPDKSKEIKKRGEVIGEDRVMAGVHHPSDITSGRLMGKKIYESLKKSKTFQDAFQKAAQSLKVRG